MSHFTVLVVGPNPEKQLAPFDENINGGDDNKKWDWYSLGGRWTGYLKMKAGDRAKALLGQPGVFSNEAKPGWADAALKQDIDFEGMRVEAAREAGERYDRAIRIIDDRPFESWEEICARESNLDKARAIYNAQPVLKDFTVAKIYFWQDGPEQFRASREQFLEKARQMAISTFAVIKDGKWYERGSMGWWGVVSDEKDENEWVKQFSNLLDSLPDDTLLSIYDCHI